MGGDGMRVVQLLPGQIFDGNTYVGQFPHPLYPQLQCVVWRKRDGGWSHDALSPAQEIGEPDQIRSLDLRGNLQKVLLGEAAA